MSTDSQRAVSTLCVCVCASCVSDLSVCVHVYVMNEQNVRHRVKLYALNKDRQWTDRGTGFVMSTFVEKMQGFSLLVRDERDGSLLLESRIQRDTLYQKQQETLIVWSEGDNLELALSFQEKAGCEEVWCKICQVRGCDPSLDTTQELVDESEEERYDDLSDSYQIDLPPAELARLSDILQIFSNCLENAARRERLSLAIESDNYIPKLMQLFRMCEDIEDLNSLYHLHDIVKNLFYLNKSTLLETMFRADTLFDVVGCLEYDRNSVSPKQHRHYLRQMANFKEVLPIRNSELLAKIHQTYRTQYVQDVVLPTPSVFEDNMLSSLSSFIFFNKLDIVKQLQADEKFLTEFFSLLSEERTALSKRRDLVLFLKEFCSFSYTMQQPNKESFFRTLLSLGVLAALETTLAVDCGAISTVDAQTVRAACVDVLSSIVETVPALVREYMLRQGEACDDDQLMLNLILEQMVCDRDPEVGSAVQLSGIIRVLVDPDNMMAALNRSEKTEFLSFFYKHCIHNLVAPLLANTTGERPMHDDAATVQLMNIILELLAFCVEHHTFHAKNFLITRNLVSRVLVLIRSRHRYLSLDALRFLRKMVAMRDDTYDRHIVKQNLFAPVVDVFCENRGRYNLLDSAIIELFEFIKTENIRLLITYSVETFGERVSAVTYVPTFRALHQRYEQNRSRVCQTHHDQRLVDTPPPPTLEGASSVLLGSVGVARFRRDPRQMDEEEEMWFNEESEFDGGCGEDSSATTVATGTAERVSDSVSPNHDQQPQNNRLLESDVAVSSTASSDLQYSAVDTQSVATRQSDDSPEPQPHRLTHSPEPLHTGVSTQSSPHCVQSGDLTVRKVGLVDYDADSDDEADTSVDSDTSDDPNSAPLYNQDDHGTERSTQPPLNHSEPTVNSCEHESDGVCGGGDDDEDCGGGGGDLVTTSTKTTTTTSSPPSPPPQSECSVRELAVSVDSVEGNMEGICCDSVEGNIEGICCDSVGPLAKRARLS